MNVNYFVVGAICFSCLLFVIRAVKSSIRDNLGWILVSILVSASALFLLQIDVAIGFAGGLPPREELRLRSIAPAISLALWLLLLVLPSFGYGTIRRLMFQQQYASARRLAQLLRWLHPFDGWWQQPQLLFALELADAGKLTEAQSIFKGCRCRSDLKLVAQVMLYWMQADWQKCLVWMEKNLSKSKLNSDSNLAIYYLRALGEVGDLNRLIAGLKRLELQQSIPIFELNLVRMFALAFCGQTAAVSYLFRGILSNYSFDTQRFWLATAQMAAGNPKAQQQLQQLQLHTNPLLQRAVEWRLSHQLASQDQLTPASQVALTQIQRNISKESRYRNIERRDFKRIFATYAIVLINIIVFGLEIRFGGSENVETLHQLGGLDPTAVIQGEWWRLITANFLHFGWLHLATNMAGLCLFAPFVEFNLGSFRFILVYFLLGATAMLAFTFVAIQTGAPEQILVGASAAIMGIIGLTIAILIRDLRLIQSRIVARKLRVLIFIVLLQFTFDYFTPQVSLLSHLLGLIAGLLVGFMFANRLKIRFK